MKETPPLRARSHPQRRLLAGWPGLALLFVISLVVAWVGPLPGHAQRNVIQWREPDGTQRTEELPAPPPLTPEERAERRAEKQRREEARREQARQEALQKRLEREQAEREALQRKLEAMDAQLEAMDRRIEGLTHEEAQDPDDDSLNAYDRHLLLKLLTKRDKMRRKQEAIKQEELRKKQRRKTPSSPITQPTPRPPTRPVRPPFSLPPP